MKKATTCVICHCPLRESYGYKVRFERRYENKITGELEVEIVEGLACPPCNKAMGYSTSKKKLRAFEEKDIYF